MTRPIARSDNNGSRQRAVSLASHGEDADWTEVYARATTDRHHATVGFSGYWHDASIAMSVAELEQFRDAINAVLVQATS